MKKIAYSVGVVLSVLILSVVIVMLIQTMEKRPYETTLVAGNLNTGYTDGTATVQAMFREPKGLWIYEDTLYIADENNNLVRTLKDGQVSTFAGHITGYDAYGYALSEEINGEQLLSFFAKPTAVLSVNDIFYVLDRENNMIRTVQDGQTTSYIGSQISGYQDGSAGEVAFNHPTDFCADEEGNIYVVDTENQVIRKVAPDGTVSTVAGQVGVIGNTDGEAQEASFHNPMGIAYDDQILYISDTGNHVIRAMSLKKNTVTTFAGTTSLLDDSGNALGDYLDGDVEEAYFHAPVGIAVDKRGTVYVADSENSVIRKIQRGKVSTVLLTTAYKEDTGNEVDLIMPYDIVIDDDTLYISDSFQNIILRATR